MYNSEYTVGVTGTGSLIGQAILKSINYSNLKNRLRIIGFDYFTETVGSYWCNQNYVLPDILNPKVNENEWIDKIIEYINKESIKIILIGVDFELPLFSKFRVLIKNITNCDIIVAEDLTIKIGNDKFLTYEFLRNNALSYPSSYLPEDFDFSKLEFPFVIKPRIGARSKNVFIINSYADFEDKIKEIDKPLIQEYVGRSEEEYTCSALKLPGKNTEVIILRRELKEGNTFKAEFAFDFPVKIYEYVHAVAEKLDFIGSCNFQLRLDNKGTPKIFEINPRHSGTTYIRALFGFNEVENILRYYFNFPLIEFELREGKIVRYFNEKFVEDL